MAFHQYTPARPPHTEQKHPNYYLARTIEQKCRQRRLYVPSPRLAWVQRYLLRHVLARALNRVPDYVTSTPGKSIYDNAAAHVGQRFVVNLDLKNFFPSIRIDQIIRMLSGLSIPLLTEVFNETVRDYVAREVPWSPAAAVLAARLVTYRGRLPQGAPTSPAIANLVFQRVDEKIKPVLGEDFIYTRYVDDLTISLSRPAAQRQRIRTCAEMRERVVSLVGDVLGSHCFRLNTKKTRVTKLGSEGSGELHTVTGLRVGARSVSLPRKTTRQLRSMEHRMRSEDNLLEAARCWKGPEIENEIRAVADEQYHVRGSRRLSMERLAVQLLKKLHPDLVVESVPTSGKKGKDRSEQYTGRRAWLIIERALNWLWTGQAIAEANRSAVVLKNVEGNPLCQLTSRNRADFFLLQRWECFVCTELWMHVRGQMARLKVPGRHQAVCAGITEWHNRLFDTLKDLKLRVATPITKDRAVVPASSHRPSDTHELLPRKSYEESSQRLLTLLASFYREAVNEDVPGDWKQEEKRFLIPPDNQKRLGEWLNSAASLCLRKLPLWPAPEETDSGDPIRWLQILSDRYGNERCPFYEAEGQICGDRVQKLTEETAILECTRRLMEGLVQTFEKSMRDRQGHGVQGWRETLRPNPWHNASNWQKVLSGQLEEECSRFEKVHNRLVQLTILRREKRKSLPAFKDQFSQIPQAEVSSEAWEHLFTLGKALIKTTSENLVGDLSDFTTALTEAEVSAKKALDVWFLLRCRDAHPLTREKLSEWERLQTLVARRLTKKPPPKRSRDHSAEEAVELFDGSYLELSCLEVCEVKLHLLRDYRSGLDQLAAQREDRK